MPGNISCRRRAAFPARPTTRQQLFTVFVDMVVKIRRKPTRGVRAGPIARQKCKACTGLGGGGAGMELTAVVYDRPPDLRYLRPTGNVRVIIHEVVKKQIQQYIPQPNVPR